MSEEKTPDDLDLDLTPEEEQELLDQALANLMQFVKDETTLSLWEEGEWTAIPGEDSPQDPEQPQEPEL
jgi:hypothetical protein